MDGKGKGLLSFSYNNFSPMWEIKRCWRYDDNSNVDGMSHMSCAMTWVMLMADGDAENNYDVGGQPKGKLSTYIQEQKKWFLSECLF